MVTCFGTAKMTNEDSIQRDGLGRAMHFQQVRTQEPKFTFSQPEFSAMSHGRFRHLDLPEWPPPSAIIFFNSELPVTCGERATACYVLGEKCQDIHCPLGRASLRPPSTQT